MKKTGLREVHHYIHRNSDILKQDIGILSCINVKLHIIPDATAHFYKPRLCPE